MAFAQRVQVAGCLDQGVRTSLRTKAREPGPSFGAPIGNNHLISTNQLKDRWFKP